MDNDKQFNQWLKERDAAVRSMDVGKFKAFVLKWQKKGAYLRRPLPSDHVCEITLRKMACNITTMPKTVQKKAAAWLKERGYDTKIYTVIGGENGQQSK